MSEVAARLRKRSEDKAAAAAPPPRDFGELYAIRARILGVLIRDARLTKGITDEACAYELRVPLNMMRAWELGQESPTLPQLEMLAYFLGVPVSHFWDTKTITAQQEARRVPQDSYFELRDRVIGTLLRVARQEAKLSQADLAGACGLSAEDVADYEFGRKPVPFTHLSSLAGALKVSLSYFIDNDSRVGDWLNREEAYRRFSELPDPIRAFVSQPSNRVYLELAMKLSKLPVNDLRDVGESILDITH
jgi:transcriptional regulator with XRE-family HTH domain